MGSKKHKKHHRSEKKESKEGKPDRQEKPLKLVLKVGGSSSSIQAPAPLSPSIQSDVLQGNIAIPHAQGQQQQAVEQKNISHQVAVAIPGPSSVINPGVSSHQQLPIGDQLLVPKEEKIEPSTESHHSHDKHKKSKKKKKKKSSDRDRDKHQKRHKHHHHHHHHREHSHERKEKRRREHDHEHGSKDIPQKRLMMESHSILCGDRQNRDPRSCTMKKKSTKTHLQLLLSYFLKTFQKKDPQQFFAWPVSDVIAPGYSSIISNPMDFSTMKAKIEAKDYKCIGDFKNDLKLMCDNAMIYNRPDTIYFKSAKKMWHGQKLFTREQLLSLSRNLPFILDIPPEELGFDPKEHLEEFMEGSSELPSNESPEMRMKKHKSKHSDDKNYAQSDDDDEDDDDDDDDMAPDEILIQAQKAARAAADKLTLKKPNSQFAFLRQKDDGSTSLAILNPKGAEEKEVKLENLMGKLGHGGGSITGFKEDPKNIVRPVKNLNYGSFCSYAPQYDSMFSNLTKDESILVLNTYGDELGAQYAESLMSFAKDCDYVMTMVDNMLDALTGGMHSKTIKQLEERRKTNKSKAPDVVVNGNIPQEMDYSNTNGMEEQSKGPKHVLQHKLDETSAFLQDLAKAQHQRLSQTPPSHLSNIQGASNAEVELAEKVTRGLTEITSQINPGNVIGLHQIRKAMGISYEPIPIVTTSSPSPILIDHNALNHTIDSMVDEEHKSIEMMEQDQTNSNNKGESNLDCELREFLDSSSMLQGCETSSL